jgi:CelD/BcsL family acetyltransferase involved in cellulose biosynthesis
MEFDGVVRPLTDARWLSFVTGHPEALPFHHPSWAAMLAECYGFRAFCLTVDDRGGRIVAGLPIVEIRRPRGRPRWVSLPFTDSCPPLATDKQGVDLAAKLDQLRRAFEVSRLEVRAEMSGRGAHPDGSFLTHELPLSGSDEEVFRSLHHSQVRRNIRRAERSGVTVRTGTAEVDLTKVFYGLHTRTRRRLGVPVQPLRYFRLLWKRILQPGLGAVMIAEVGDVPVAAAVFLRSSGVCVYKYGASDERQWAVRPNHLLFWEAIRWAAAHGCRTFDFGRTDVEDRGLREFKARWGTVERKLVYTVLADAPPRARRSGVPAPLRAVIRRGPRVVPRAVGELLYRYTA